MHHTFGNTIEGIRFLMDQKQIFSFNWKFIVFSSLWYLQVRLRQIYSFVLFRFRYKTENCYRTHIFINGERDNGKFLTTNFVSCLTIPVIPYQFSTYHSKTLTQSHTQKKADETKTCFLLRLTFFFPLHTYTEKKKGQQK